MPGMFGAHPLLMLIAIAMIAIVVFALMTARILGWIPSHRAYTHAATVWMLQSSFYTFSNLLRSIAVAASEQ